MATLTLDKLNQVLAQGPMPPLISVFGDTPLLLDDALQLIRNKAREQGVDERTRYIQDAQFDWAQLSDNSASLSLFSSHRLIELELPEAKPGREGSDALKRYCADLPQDQTLVITGPKLRGEQLKAKWYQLLADTGPVVQANQPDRRQLPGFVQQRAQLHQVQLLPDAIQLLSDWYEGNLLALDQELQKLALTDLPQPISIEAIQAATADHSRFNVFALQDLLLYGDLKGALHRLQRLLDEDEEIAILNWLFQREWQKLIALKSLPNAGKERIAKLAQLGIWRNQEPAYQQLLQRLDGEKLAVIGKLTTRLEYAFKRDSGEHLPTLMTHLILLYCAQQPIPELLTAC